VWQPIQDHLNDAVTVLVSPDGPLHALPFAGLPGSVPGTYLIEEFAIATIPVPALLPTLHARSTAMRNGEADQPEKGAPRPPSLLVIGDADYGGNPGTAFIQAGGTIIKKKLQGETLRVDTGCIVAFTPGITYDIARAGNLKSMFFGGEGLFLATLSGHGTVLLQSLPFSRLADRVIQHAPSVGGSSQGEGSVLGGLGNLFGD
jgi:hypothetical protein